MLPHERSLVKKWANEPFAIVGVNSDSPAKLKEMVANGTTIWRNFAAGRGGGTIAKQWGVTGWPTIYVLDHKGVIRFKGPRGKDLEEALAGLIKEAKADKSASKTDTTAN